MPRYRVLYAKEGPAMYISHLDLIRIFERAARRAGLPLAFTQGFNPHPKLSFAAPLAVGTVGEAEFADLELTGDIPAEVVVKSLSGVMPEGLRVIEIRLVPDSAPALMAAVSLAGYTARAVLAAPLDKEMVEKAIAEFLARPEILVERRSKSGDKRIFDIKPGIFTMSAQINDDIIVLDAELKTGSSGNIRFEELLGAFTRDFKIPLRGNFALCRRALYAAGRNQQDMLW
jgi:radical SAM-linked protein